MTHLDITLSILMAEELHKQDHLWMNEALVIKHTIILDLHIFLDHRSLSSIGQKILMILPPPFPIPPFRSK